MKDRSLWGHTLIAGVCVAMAYVAWTHPTITDKDDAVVLLPGDKEALTGLTWHDADTDVGVARRLGADADAAGPNIEVSVTKLQPPTPPEVFPGSEAAKQLLGSIAPLMAARDLGPMDANQRQAFGLDAPKTKLTLHFGERAASVDVGHTTFGSGDYYVEGPNHHAYLMRAATVSALGHGAVRLQDRDIAGVGRDKFNRLVVTHGGKSKTFVQRHPELAAEAFFADTAEPDRKLENVAPWVDRVLRLRVVSFADAAPAQEAVMSVSFFWDKTQKATLRVWPATERGAVVIAPRFKQPALVSKASIEGVLADLATMLGEVEAGSKAP